MDTVPDRITLCNLTVVLMPNGEVIGYGRTLGWFKDFKEGLTVKEDEK